MISLQRTKSKELVWLSPTFPVSKAHHGSLGWVYWVSQFATYQHTERMPPLYTPVFSPFWNEFIFTLPRNMATFLQPTERPLKESFPSSAEGSRVCQSVSSHVRVSCPIKEQGDDRGHWSSSFGCFKVAFYLVLLLRCDHLSIYHHFQVGSLKSKDHVQRSQTTDLSTLIGPKGWIYIQLEFFRGVQWVKFPIWIRI